MENNHLPLKKYIEEVTTSGKTQLDEQLIKKIKFICRQSDAGVEQAYNLLFQQLQKEHAEIRFSAFLVIDQLFNRSHLFRELLIEHFQEFLELTAEIDFEQPLPPPLAAAKLLKEKSLLAVHEWHNKYGQGYKALKLGYSYLKDTLKVDFTLGSSANDVVLNRENQRQLIIDNRRREQCGKCRREMTENYEELNKLLQEVSSCYELLVPVNNIDHDVSWRSDGNHSSQSCQDHISFNLEKCKKSTQLDGSSSKLTLDITERSSEEKEHFNKVNTKAEEPLVEHSDQVTEPLVEHISQVTDHSPLSVADHMSLHDELMQQSLHSGDSSSHPQSQLRELGLHTWKHSLEIRVPVPGKFTLVETADTSDILTSLTDSCKLLRMKFLPMVKRWLDVHRRALAQLRAGGSDSEQSELDRCMEHLHQVQSVKRKVDNALSKFDDLIITRLPREEKCKEVKSSSMESDSEEDSFEEVGEKEGVEYIPTHLRAEYGLTSDSDDDIESTDASSSKVGLYRIPPKSTKISQSKPTEEEVQDMVNSVEAGPSHRSFKKMKTNDTYDASTSAKASTSSDLSASAPVVEFGVDLYHWETEKLEATVVRYDVDKFWKSTGDGPHEQLPSEYVQQMRQRSIPFTGKFERVKWACRAPLSSGKLCPRMDRHKCPFHGVIIGRDETGKPQNPDDLKKLKGDTVVPDWQDPKLLRQLEAKTGINLKVIKRKGGAKKKSNLTEIKKKKSTPRERLAKRVFNKGSMRRVGADLDAVDKQRHRERFGNQFNYQLKPK